LGQQHVDGGKLVSIEPVYLLMQSFAKCHFQPFVFARCRLDEACQGKAQF
jgi:hypothetical protein